VRPRRAGVVSLAADINSAVDWRPAHDDDDDDLLVVVAAVIHRSQFASASASPPGHGESAPAARSLLQSPPGLLRRTNLRICDPLASAQRKQNEGIRFELNQMDTLYKRYRKVVDYRGSHM